VQTIYSGIQFVHSSLFSSYAYSHHFNLNPIDQIEKNKAAKVS